MNEAVKHSRKPNAREVVFGGGAIEVTKWLAAALMVADHVNRFVYGDTIPLVTESGRLAFPLFALIFGHNIAFATSRNIRKVTIKCLMFGVLAQPVHAALVGSWLPTNVLLVFAIASCALWIYTERTINIWIRITAASSLVALGGFVVDYAWFGILTIIAAWGYHRYTSDTRFFAMVIAIASLIFVNGNLYAVLAIPLMDALRYGSFLFSGVPRWKNIFYIFYPTHLVFIWAYVQGLN